MVPVVVFRPGKETPEAPPKDYLKFLMAQAKDGAEFSKVTKITVDGRPATLMHVTTHAPEGFMSGSGRLHRAGFRQAHRSRYGNPAGLLLAAGRHRCR